MPLHISVCIPSWSLGGQGEAWAYSWNTLGSGWTALHTTGGLKFGGPWEPPDPLPVYIAEIPLLDPALPQELR